MIKLIACDLDGTTLNSARLPHINTAAAILRAQAAGVTVVLASGRIYSSMSPFAVELGVDDAMICCNGAHVLGAREIELACHRLDHSVLDLVMDYAVPRGIHVNVYTRTELMFVNPSPWADLYARRLVHLKPQIVDIEEAKKEDLLKVSLVDDTVAIQQHILALAPIVDPSLARFTESEPEYLEFMHPKANKGEALKTLSEFLGLVPSELAAIGDYLNDLEMLGFAGTSAAVSNGAKAVRLAATIQAPSNNEGGVAWFIDHVIGRNSFE